MISQCYTLMLFILIPTIYSEIIKAGEIDENVYERKFEWDHLEEFMRKPELIPKFIHCFYHEQDCTIEQLRLKKFTSELLSTNCKYCSTSQSIFINNLMRYIRETYAAETFEHISKSSFNENDSETNENEDSEILIHLGTGSNQPYMEYLKSQRIVQFYMKCFLDEGKCSAEGFLVKSMLSNILNTNCSTCTTMQKLFYNKIISHLRTNYPNELKKLLNRYILKKEETVDMLTNPQYTEFTSNESDFKRLMDDDNLAISVLECFLDKMPCSTFGHTIKIHVAEILKTNCSKCSPQQKKVIDAMFKHMQTKFPNLYNELHEKHISRDILITKQEFEYYMNCLLNDIKCIPEDLKLKQLLPDMILSRFPKDKMKKDRLCNIIIKYFKNPMTVNKKEVRESRINQNIYKNLILEDIDPHKMMSDNYTVESFLKCILSNYNCSSTEIALKNMIPKALAGRCRNCTQRQKYIVINILQILQKKYPGPYFQLYDKYDPYRKIGGPLIRDSWNVFYTKMIREDISMNKFMRSKNLIHSYTKCFLDKSKCTPEGIKLKKIIINILTTNCASCLQFQRQFYNKILMCLWREYPAKYNQLSDKYMKTFMY